MVDKQVAFLKLWGRGGCCRLFPKRWTVAHQAPLSSTISQSLFKFMAIESVMPSNHLILCCPLLLLPSIFHSIRVFPMSWFFTSGGQSIGASTLASSPSNEYSGLISFRIDWSDLLAVQGTFASSPEPQFKSINSLALSLLYGLTHICSDYWKNHSLDYRGYRCC